MRWGTGEAVAMYTEKCTHGGIKLRQPQIPFWWGLLPMSEAFPPPPSHLV